MWKLQNFTLTIFSQKFREINLFLIFQADAERIKLEKLAEELVHLEDEESQEYLMEVRKILEYSPKMAKKTVFDKIFDFF